MPNIVHIGLGKTATTTLQEHIFPLLCKLKGFEYNQPKVMRYSLKSVLMGLSDTEHNIMRNALNQRSHFFSSEMLSHWDPACWEIAAERNLRVFGRDTIIIITLREAYSYIRSVYQQHVQSGNVVRPEFFFLDKVTYHNFERYRSENKLEYYCTDYLDYQNLFEFYTSRFAKVVCVDLKNIGNFDFLDDIIDLDEHEKRQLVDAFQCAPRRNTSYSSSAMKLTLWRERILKKVWLKSIGSTDGRYGKGLWRLE